MRLLPWMTLGALALLSALTTAQVPKQGFCGDCQTFAYAMEPCGYKFGPAQIEINGFYNIEQSLAKCQCTAVMQQMLWRCARCERDYGGHQVEVMATKAHRSLCVTTWGVPVADYDAPYTGAVAPGTETPTGSTNNPSPPAGGNGGSGSTPSGTSPSSSGSPPSPSSDTSLPDNNKSEDGGPNGAAIGISAGIIGVAVICGLVAMTMMRRRRHRRHEPLELNPPPLSGYSNLDDQWEKPGHTSSASGGPMGGGTGGGNGGETPAVAASRMPMQGRPEPFESRPYAEQHQMPPIAYTGPHNKNGYDGYEGYDGYDNHHPGGYDPNYYDHYNQHQYPPQHPPHHEYYDPHAPQHYRNPKGPESVVSGGYV